MRFITILILLLIKAISSYTQELHQSVYIYGKVENYETEVQVEDMSDMGELQFPNLERTFIPDTSGRFSISFSLINSNYFRIGRNILFLRPGDTLYAEIDFNKPSKAFFAGNCSFENTYLKSTPYPKAGSFLESGDNIKASVKETIDTILSIAKKRNELLKSYESKVTTEFRMLENARIKCDIINSLLHIEIYYPQTQKINKDSLAIFRQNLYVQLNPYLANYSTGMLNSTYLKIAVYRNVLNTIVKNSSESKIPSIIKDWLQAKNLMKQISQVKNINDTALINNTIQKINSLPYKNMLSIALGEVLNLNNGAEAVNFSANNLLNEAVNLTDFKGKVIYIKVWATWCEPCINEFTYYDKLREYYKDNTNIVFISLSIDENAQRWSRFMNSRNSTGIEWRISRTLLTQYRVVEIPRNIIIGKEFKVEALFGLPPNNIKTPIFLDELLKK